MTYYHLEVQNPDATPGKKLEIRVTSNVPLEQIAEHVKANSRLDHPWLVQQPENEREIVIVGGGPSAATRKHKIRELRDNGAFVLAINGASRWLSIGGLYADTQFMIDAKEESEQLVDLNAKSHFFASQVHPTTMGRVNDVIMFHLMTPGIESYLPEERVKAGGYALIGGGASAGNSAICAAYALGYRKMHLFGFDSSYDGAVSHAYSQPMNAGEGLVDVKQGNAIYTASMTMKLQADFFMRLAPQLEAMGCEIEVHGDGLLPDRWRASKHITNEKEKYTYIWTNSEYRNVSPAEDCVQQIVDFCEPGPVIDFGCGTGRASIALDKLGYDVTLVDIADNCRDEDALSLSFLEWDLTEPLPIRAPYGYCCDVMEHIPPSDVDAVLTNISSAVDKGCFFRIEHGMDGHGPALIGSPLHLSVHDEHWWAEKLRQFWPSVESRGDGVFLASANS